MGAGKTTVLAEASDILRARAFAHAAIDLDALGIVHLPQVPAESADDLTYRNLAHVWRNFESAGVTNLLVAAAIENREQLDRLRQAVPGARTVVCRLMVSVGTMERRVQAREPGMLQAQLVA